MGISAEEEVGEHLDRLLLPFADEANDGAPTLRLEIRTMSGGGYGLVRDGEVLLAGVSTLGILNRTLAEVNRAAVRELESFAVHAGVVGSQGAAIAFPSRTGGGKSTLTAACLRAGFDYWSDEALVLSAEGEVVPYPKPLSLSARSRRLLDLGDGGLPGGDLQEVAMPPAELGAEVGLPGGRLAHVLVLDRADRAPTLVALSSGETVTALLSHSFNHFRRPEAAYRLACRVAAGCRAWRLSYDDPRGAAELLWQRFASSPS